MLGIRNRSRITAAILVLVASHALAQPQFGDVARREAEPAVLQVQPRDAGGTVSGYGSGFLVNGEGAFVITTYSLIREARRLTVKLHGGDAADAIVWHIAPEYDLALLQLLDPKTHLPPRRLPELAILDVGADRDTYALAMGYETDAQFTMNRGTVFDKHGPAQLATRLANELRNHFGQRANWIQTNAEITPAMAGGPLVDQHGRVIGVNSTARLALHNSVDAYECFAIDAVHLSRFIRSRPARPLQEDPNELHLEDQPLPLNQIAIPWLPVPINELSPRTFRIALAGFRANMNCPLCAGHGVVLRSQRRTNAQPRTDFSMLPRVPRLLNGQEVCLRCKGTGLKDPEVIGTHLTRLVGSVAATDFTDPAQDQNARDFRRFMDMLIEISGGRIVTKSAQMLSDGEQIPQGASLIVTGNMIEMPGGGLRAVFTPEGDAYLVRRLGFGAEHTTGSFVVGGRYVMTITPWGDPVHVLQDAFFIHLGPIDMSLTRPRWEN